MNVDGVLNKLEEKHLTYLDGWLDWIRLCNLVKLRFKRYNCV